MERPCLSLSLSPGWGGGAGAPENLWGPCHTLAWKFPRCLGRSVKAREECEGPGEGTAESTGKEGGIVWRDGDRALATGFRLLWQTLCEFQRALCPPSIACEQC